MPELPISLACGDYDRVAALRDGRIRPDGLSVTFLTLSPEEIFFRMIRHAEFDVAELSLSSYVLSLESADPPFVAVPVFPSRSFRHSAIYVRSGSAIESPEGLRGGRVGLAEYQLTANVWIRGILSDRHGLDATDVTYVVGGLENPKRIEKLKLNLPGDVHLDPAPQGMPLSRLLANGEIDAIYSPREPSTFATGEVRHLFADPPAAERVYLEETGVFPIMHVVAIRRSLYERHPWIAQSLMKAFLASRDRAVTELLDGTALKVMLPWLIAQVREARELLGNDIWSYGFEPNRSVLETFLRYAAEQGLVAPGRDPASLFVPESLEGFAV
jgi:ABC-type nitrate/sulfonate/bicarbonate transport system substrate-binding protein